jgi:hypothetical protein
MAKNISYGVCEICGHRTTKGHMLRHLKKCLETESWVKNNHTQLYQFRIEAYYLPMYWLDIEIGANKVLRDLDEFLRDIWLECCGHMSQFQINEYHYVMPYDGSYEIWEHEGSMDIALFDALGTELDEIAYEYDFGTTTYLKLGVIGKREGKIKRKGLRLLARNEAPDWQCAKCDQTATDICSYCYYESGAAFCEAHKKDHGCDEEYFLPVVNSPRTGVCGYCGPGEKYDF